MVFSTGHLPAKESSRRGYRTLAITYLTFGPKGNELLVNIGGEQVYLFDVNKARHPKLFTVGDYPLRPGTNGVHKKGMFKNVLHHHVVLTNHLLKSCRRSCYPFGDECVEGQIYQLFVFLNECYQWFKYNPIF